MEGEGGGEREIELNRVMNSRVNNTVPVLAKNTRGQRNARFFDIIILIFSINQLFIFILAIQYILIVGSPVVRPSGNDTNGLRFKSRIEIFYKILTTMYNSKTSYLCETKKIDLKIPFSL